MTTFRELRPVGRPPFEVTEEVLEEVFYMRSRGLTIEQTAHNLGINKSTLYEHQAKNEDLSDAIKMGKASSVLKVSNVLFEKATIDKETVAAIYWNKSMGGLTWNPDKQVPNIEIHNDKEVSDTEFLTKLGNAMHSLMDKENKEDE